MTLELRFHHRGAWSRVLQIASLRGSWFRGEDASAPDGTNISLRNLQNAISRFNDVLGGSSPTQKRPKHPTMSWETLTPQFLFLASSTLVFLRSCLQGLTRSTQVVTIATPLGTNFVYSGVAESFTYDTCVFAVCWKQSMCSSRVRLVFTCVFMVLSVSVMCGHFFSCSSVDGVISTVIVSAVFGSFFGSFRGVLVCMLVLVFLSNLNRTRGYRVQGLCLVFSCAFHTFQFRIHLVVGIFNGSIQLRKNGKLLKKS